MNLEGIIKSKRKFITLDSGTVPYISIDDLRDTLTFSPRAIRKYFQNEQFSRLAILMGKKTSCLLDAYAKCIKETHTPTVNEIKRYFCYDIWRVLPNLSRYGFIWTKENGNARNSTVIKIDVLPQVVEIYKDTQNSTNL